MITGRGREKIVEKKNNNKWQHSRGAEISNTLVSWITLPGCVKRHKGRNSDLSSQSLKMGSEAEMKNIRMNENMHEKEEK